MSRLHGVSWVADRIRRAGLSYLFGQELGCAQFTHWTTQWYPSRLVTEIQWEMVTELVAYAREASSFYRQRFANIASGSNLTPEAFQRIPPLRRSDVVSSSATIRVIAANGGVMRRQSGGTSGLEVRIPLNMATYCWYIAGLWRGLRWWGADFSDRGAILLGSGGSGLRGLAVRGKDWLMNWLRLPVHSRFNQRAPRILDRLAAFGPAFIYGYPSAVHRLARVAKDRGWQPGGKLRVIVLTGEPVYDFQRRSIAEIFQCPVAEEYGNGELGSMAFECPEGSLHMTTENVFLETVGIEPSSDGSGGLILATQLRNRLFPLIRYETGDIGVLDAAACRCKRGLPVIRVSGRARDRLVGNGGDMLARSRVEDLLSALPERLQGCVQIIHTKRGCIVLQVERNSDGRTDLTAAAAVGAATFGPDWHVGTVEVEQLVRLPSGKLPYILRRTAHT